MSFTYELATGQTPPEEVIWRSNKYRALRQSLTDLEVDEWLKIDLSKNSFSKKDGERAADLLRTQVYNWSSSYDLKKYDQRMSTYVEKNGDNSVIAVWIIKKVKDPVQ